MKNLKLFNYNGNGVRTIEKDGQPWLVLRDVCKVLEINHITDTANRLDKDEVDLTEVTDKLGREQNTYIINESGLYAVILRSDKPQAKPFRKWVTSEVLPSIRKTGTYSIKGYELKATSVGEIVNLLKLFTKSMENQNCNARDIAEMQADICKNFNIPVPHKLIKKDLYDQMSMIVLINK